MLLRGRYNKYIEGSAPFRCHSLLYLHTIFLSCRMLKVADNIFHFVLYDYLVFAFHWFVYKSPVQETPAGSII